jgi:hypothetical protein
VKKITGARRIPDGSEEATREDNCCVLRGFRYSVRPDGGRMFAPCVGGSYRRFFGGRMFAPRVRP